MFGLPMQSERLSTVRFPLFTIAVSRALARADIPALPVLPKLRLSVGRDVADNVVVTVECMKDGEPGEVIVSKLERIEVGIDDDGDPITSCIVVEAEGVGKESGRKHVSRNAQTFFSIQ